MNYHAKIDFDGLLTYFDFGQISIPAVAYFFIFHPNCYLPALMTYPHQFTFDGTVVACTAKIACNPLEMQK